MESKKLGTLTNENYPNTWESQPVAVPFFNNAKIPFIIEANKEDLSEIDEVIGNFLNLTPESKDDASKYLYKHYQDIVKAVDKDDVDCTIESEADIWNHVTPTNIIVRKRPEDHVVYIQVLAECRWEREHGIQIVYKDGNRLSRVSEQDGHLTYSDAYDVSDSEDRVYG